MASITMSSKLPRASRDIYSIIKKKSQTATGHGETCVYHWLVGFAFLRAGLKLTSEVRDDHASYIASWLEVLKNGKVAIVRAASYAQKAVDFLHSLHGKREKTAADSS